MLTDVIKGQTGVLQAGSLAAALVLYALWGAPTPDNPGFIEVLIAFFLLLAFGLAPYILNSVFFLKYAVPPWKMAGSFLFCYGLIVTSVVSLSGDAALSHIVRDIVAFTFLCLPVFFVPSLKFFNLKFFEGALVFIGVVFSARVLLPHMPFFAHDGELLYLSNSPLVLFGALLFIGMALQNIYKSTTFAGLLKGTVCIALAVMILAAMFVDVQRATFGAVVMTVLSLFLIGVVRAPLRMVVPSLIVILFMVLVWPYWQDISTHMVHKTSQVGLNMRLQELMAVWDAVSVNSLSVLFGLGWGAHYVSPAVGGMDVTYTHSLLSYMFLKTGLIGLGLTLIYLFFIFEKIVRLYLIDPIKGNAVLWPFLVPIILYASYKSFDFGLLLTLIVLMADRATPQTVSESGKVSYE